MKTSPEPWNRLNPNSRWHGWMPGDNTQENALPVLAARGIADGPTLLVTGGVHGDEYEGPMAIFQFFEQLNTAHLKGQIIGIPTANPAAWRARTRTTPADGGDLNRHFPRKNPGTETGELAERLFNHFVQHCDILIDLHSGGARMVHLPLIGWYRQTEKTAEHLARNFHCALHPWLIPDAVGVLSYEAARIGKTAFGAEWGGGAALDPAGASALRVGLFRTLQVLQIYEGDRLDCSTDTREPIAGDYQETAVSGLFSAGVALGQTVEDGSVLGSIRNSLGEVISRPTAFRRGTIAALPHLAWIHAGERFAYIG